MIAFVNLVNDEGLDESVTYLQKALAILPGSENVAYILGQIYMRQKDFDRSQQIFENISQNASNPQLKAMAQNFLKIIGEIKNQKQVIEEYQKQNTENSGLSSLKHRRNERRTDEQIAE